MIWITANRGLMNWSTEASVVSLVTQVLRDAVDVLGLPDISVEEEVTIHTLRPDLLVVRMRKQPIGVVEVKTPNDDSIINHGRVHGQIYDYMCRLNEYFGLKSVFGIVTTYEKWRVYWLAESDPVAISNPRPHYYTHHLVVQEPDDTDTGSVNDIAVEKVAR